MDSRKVSFEWETLVSYLQQGQKLLWNGKFHDAETFANERRHFCFWAATLYSEIQVWKAMFSDSMDVHQEGFQRIKTARILCSEVRDLANPSRRISGKKLSESDQVLKNLPAVQRQLLHVGAITAGAENTLYKAVIHFKRLNYVRGAYFVRKSWKEYQSAHQLFASINKRLEEAVESTDRDHGTNLLVQLVFGLICFGVGVFHFGISQVPPSFRWLVEAIGFEGNRVSGIRELQKCATTCCPKATAADLCLGLIEGYYFDNLPAIFACLDNLSEQFSTSAVILSCYGYLYRLEGQLDRSSEYFKLATERANEIPQWQLILEYELAHNLWLQLEWEECARIVEKYLQESEMKVYKSFACYKLGICYWMTNQPDKIAPIFKRVPEFVRPNIAYDRYALRKTKEFLKLKANQRNFDTFDVSYISATNLAEGKNYELALATVESCGKVLEEEPDGSKKKERLACFYYLKGAILKELRQFEEAEEILLKCVNLSSSVKKETYVIPFSYVVLAESCVDKPEPDLKKAVSYVNKAKKYSGYDFDNIIPFRMNRVLTRARALGKEAEAINEAPDTASPSEEVDLSPALLAADADIATKPSSEDKPLPKP